MSRSRAEAHFFQLLGSVVPIAGEADKYSLGGIDIASSGYALVIC